MGTPPAGRGGTVRRLWAGMECLLPEDLDREASAALEEWSAGGKVRRLWSKDPALWTGGDEGRWLGWLDVTIGEMADPRPFVDLAEAVRAGGFAHVVLMGMGGSSLAGEVYARCLGPAPGFPSLLVLDSTDPAQIRSVERRTDPARTLHLVASKSGTTLEADLLLARFFDRARSALGFEKAGRNFVAVTDPGSPLDQRARGEGYRAVLHGNPGVGGRYSALSPFGLAAAAVLGADVPALLERAERMAEACGPETPVEANPGVALGILLALAARQGRDKVTLLLSPRLAPLGGWIEQLLAESTGKRGTGIVPVDGEPLGAPEAYGNDRIFVGVREAGETEPERISGLGGAGHPVVRWTVGEPLDLAQEFFRWEIAAAVAGSLLGINPFDQPDVEESKRAARRITEAAERQGGLPDEEPFFAQGDLRLFADEATRETLCDAAGSPPTLPRLLGAHLARLRPGDYFALLVFLDRTESHERVLEALRLAVRDRKGTATLAGFGPRYLHSTGQLFKGGPDTGVFLMVTAEGAEDVKVPGRKATFGMIEAAQARGDLEVLLAHRRRALRVHLGSDRQGGLALLHEALLAALG